MILRSTCRSRGNSSASTPLAYAIGSPLIITFTGKVDRRRMMQIGLVLIALGSLAGAATPSFGWLFASRVVVAIGAGHGDAHGIRSDGSVKRPRAARAGTGLRIRRPDGGAGAGHASRNPARAKIMAGGRRCCWSRGWRCWRLLRSRGASRRGSRFPRHRATRFANSSRTEDCC